MKESKTLIKEFLSKKNIAVTGVSRKNEPKVGNILYKKFRSAGYNVFAVNPNAIEVEGDKCYPSVNSVPSSIDAVVVATSPDQTLNVVKECKEARIEYVWIHSSLGKGSYNEEAVKYCEENKINIIPTGCPMMHIKPVDFAHVCFKGILKLTGKVPFGV